MLLSFSSGQSCRSTLLGDSNPSVLFFLSCYGKEFIPYTYVRAPLFTKLILSFTCIRFATDLSLLSSLFVCLEMAYQASQLELINANTTAVTRFPSIILITFALPCLVTSCMLYRRASRGFDDADSSIRSNLTRRGRSRYAVDDLSCSFVEECHAFYAAFVINLTAALACMGKTLEFFADETAFASLVIGVNIFVIVGVLYAVCRKYMAKCLFEPAQKLSDQIISIINHDREAAKKFNMDKNALPENIARVRVDPNLAPFRSFVAQLVSSANLGNFPPENIALVRIKPKLPPFSMLYRINHIGRLPWELWLQILSLATGLDIDELSKLGEVILKGKDNPNGMQPLLIWRDDPPIPQSGNRTIGLMG